MEVEGADTSIKMGRESKAVIWSDLTDSDAVSQIFSSYGYTADVDSTSAGHSEDKHTLVQRASDLDVVRRLARRNGFLFWIDSDSSGTETAHFRRPKLDGNSSVNLDINLDTNNLGTLELAWDVEKYTRGRRPAQPQRQIEYRRRSFLVTTDPARHSIPLRHYR
jgi:hypothetical protein